MKQLNALETLKNPTHGGTCCGFVDLIGKSLLRLGQPGAQPEFSQAIHQQAEDHDEAEGHDALRFFDKDGGCQKERIFEKAKPTLHATLVFVGTDEGLVGKSRWVQDIRADNPARFAQDFLHDLEVVDAHRCHQLPLVATRTGIFARTPLAPMLRMRLHLAVNLEPDRLAFQFPPQRPPRIRFTRQASASHTTTFSSPPPPPSLPLPSPTPPP